MRAIELVVSIIKRYDPGDIIGAAIWEEEDVQEAARQLTLPTPSKEAVEFVMQRVHQSDAEYGVKWDDIIHWLEEAYE